MAKTFLGGVRLAVAKSGDFIEVKPGADYDAQGEVSDLVSDLIEAAKAHKLRIAAFAPEAEGGRKIDTRLPVLGVASQVCHAHVRLPLLAAP